MQTDAPPIFRFAPSPNGLLHLGHAYSALVNKQLCAQMNGQYLLRMEDIDLTRCTPQLERQTLSDLGWLGITWDEPVRRQSEHFDDYQAALDRLRAKGLVYPSFMTRGEIRNKVVELDQLGTGWPRDPDGSPHYPGAERDWSNDKCEAMRQANPKHAWRLNMKAALDMLDHQLDWQEFDPEDPNSTREVSAHPEKWGDVVLARSETPTSYHLAVTIDDALQEVTHVVRGRDLYEATSVHRLLQWLLNLPEPLYHHHDLVIDENGRKLSKSDGDVSLKALRDSGVQASQIASLFRFASQPTETAEN